MRPVAPGMIKAREYEYYVEPERKYGGGVAGAQAFIKTTSAKGAGNGCFWE